MPRTAIAACRSTLRGRAGHLACVHTLVAWMQRLPRPAALSAVVATAGAAGGTAGGTAGAAQRDFAAAGLLEVADQNGQTPVQLASAGGHAECVAVLLDGDGGAEARRRSALHLAAQRGLADIARQLLATRR